MLTDNGREFCGTDAHPYEIYLAFNDLEHRRTSANATWALTLYQDSLLAPDLVRQSLQACEGLP